MSLGGAQQLERLGSQLDAAFIGFFKGLPADPGVDPPPPVGLAMNVCPMWHVYIRRDGLRRATGRAGSPSALSSLCRYCVRVGLCGSANLSQ
eukprot:gene10261-9065_t